MAVKSKTSSALKHRPAGSTATAKSSTKTKVKGTAIKSKSSTPAKAAAVRPSVRPVVPQAAAVPKAAAPAAPRRREMLPPAVIRMVPPNPAVPAPLPAQPPTPMSRALRILATLSNYEHRRVVRYNAENFDLDRMRNLLKKLGNPQDSFRTVHVAGTKGKGSTCAMVASMLQANGYKVGLYTSPHLIDIRERFQINGEMITEADFVKQVKAIEPIVAKLKPMPTYFDVLTAMAFKYFAEQKIEIGVIETGLGGRLDSTNVITPEVSAITSISFDHMQQLGNTLDKIATEKAGIFKPGIPALTCQQEPIVEEALKKAAEAVGAPFDVCGKTVEFSFRFESSRLLGPHNRICLTTPQSKFEHLSAPMIGEHQAVNCGLALTIIDKLKTRGIAINDARAMEGLNKAFMPGRLELIPAAGANPRIILDCAHNAASLDAMIKGAGQHIPYDSMVMIFGCCSDKDVDGMLEKVSVGADKVIFTNVKNIRTSDPAELAQKYNERFGKMCQVAATLEEALTIARRAVTKEDVICITGSFYLVGEAKKLLGSPRVSASGI